MSQKHWKLYRNTKKQRTQWLLFSREPVFYLREFVGIYTFQKLEGWMWMHLGLLENKQPVPNLKHFQLLLLSCQRTAYLEPDGVESCQPEATKIWIPAVLTLYQDPEQLGSPEEISHFSFLVSIPEFFSRQIWHCRDGKNRWNIWSAELRLCWQMGVERC